MKHPILTTLTLATTLVLVAGLAGMGRAGAAPTVAASQASVATAAPQAKVIAVKFHADWCGYCKQMGPVFQEMQAKYDREPVLFVEFDQTREFGRLQSAYLAHALGLETIWAEHGGKTGFVLLIDAQSGKVVRHLSHEQGLKVMGAALQEAVASAS